MIEIIWDLVDDPAGNVQLILEHDVNLEEVEDILLNPDNATDNSHSSGQPITFGWTSTGRYIAVIWEYIERNPKVVYPITAYPTKLPQGRRYDKQRRR